MRSFGPRSGTPRAMRESVLAKAQSAGLLGVEAYDVTVEVDVGMGLPGLHLVGLGASAVKEGGVRVRAALEHSGYKLPPRKVTVNLAPADVRKDGAAFDLPIAVGVLAAMEVIPAPALEGVLLLGELSLDGALRRVAGGLPIALLAQRTGARAVILPRSCAQEAAALSEVQVLAADSLAEVVGYLAGTHPLQRAADLLHAEDSGDPLDLAEVKGLEHVKWALEVAAAGGHNLLLIGPPGCGKSMLARRLGTILPPLDEIEALETSVVYSAAGLLSGRSLIRERPFRSPHHDVSVAGLVGGGSMPRPGEISLAHNGVLFLDELPEFRREALEALRQPLEERTVTIVRARSALRFPAAFALVGAMNPCPCGYYGSTVRVCTCELGRVRRYRAKLSGPLLDRFDLHVHVPQVPFDDLAGPREGEPSTQVRARVLAAREVQVRRLASSGLHANAQLGPRQIGRWCALDRPITGFLGDVVRHRGLSARGVHRILRVARTLADLGGRERITKSDVAGAVELRTIDQEVA